MKLLKPIRWTILSFAVLIGGFVAYQLIFNQLPKPKPNVNEKGIGSLSVEEKELVNRWGESMIVENGDFIVSENRAKTKSNHISMIWWVRK